MSFLLFALFLIALVYTEHSIYLFPKHIPTFLLFLLLQWHGLPSCLSCNRLDNESSLLLGGAPVGLGFQAHLLSSPRAFLLDHILRGADNATSPVALP